MLFNRISSCILNCISSEVVLIMFSKRVVELQTSHNLSRVDFAKSIGVTESTVRSWEKKFLNHEWEH